MLKTIYTSNSKKIPIAFIIALGCIFSMEYYSSSYLKQNYFNHEVDRVLQKINKKKFDADYLLLGDSVGRQLLRQFSKNSRFAFLATNRSIETTGQLFITKRYLQKNAKPKAVVFSGLPFFYLNLDQKTTENFVLRTFTQFNEIWTIFKVKVNPAMVVKMISYKYFQTYKYRLRLQESLAGFTNSNIYAGFDLTMKNRKFSNYSIIKIVQKKISRLILPPEKTSYVHFTELIEYLRNKGVDFYYVPVPRNKNNRKSRSYVQHERLVNNQLPTLKKKFSNFHYFFDLIEYDQSLFAGSVHLSPEGLRIGKKYMRAKIESIMRLTATSQNN